MREPSSNIGFFSTEQSRQLPQTCEIDGTKFIKVVFPFGDDRTENMWVRVTAWDDRFGVLDNDPSYATYVKDGDMVRFEPREGRFWYVRPGASSA